jgi:hypothetical protein
VTKEALVSAIRRIFRPAVRLAGLAVTLLAGLVAAPAAFASVPHPGSGGTPSPARTAVVRTVTVGGTPGWQIALLMAGAAALAALIAVLLYRMRTTRHHTLATSAR